MAQHSLRDLIRIARSDNRDDRNTLASSLGEIVLASGRKLTEQEQDLVFDILRRLIHEVDTHVRRRLADALADRRDAPHDLVVTLANDVIEVAYPILAKSPVLTDPDLIRVILEKAVEHQTAIAGRSSVSPEVSAKLVETGEPEVIRSLLDNRNARISESTMERLVADAATMPEIHEPLVRRADIPDALVRQMYEWVGEALREYLDERLAPAGEAVDWTEIDAEVERAIEDALKEDGPDEPDGVEYFEPRAGGSGYRVHPRVLVRALEDGDVFRFEEMFRDYTDLSEATVTRILYDSGPEALAIACKASGIDRYSFSDILSVLHGGNDVRRYRESQGYLKAMDYYERIDANGAKRVLEAWRNTAATA